MIGTTIGGYRILDEIGRGGMGAVYRARSVAREDAPAVALKVVLPDLLESSEAFERFRREAQIGISIQQENVVRTFEVGQAAEPGTDRPLHYLVMELVEGQTLGQLLEEIGPVAEGLLLDIARQICQGLEAIHAREVVHRDLKPANVIITADHQVKIMDLGVAKLQEQAARLTQTGQFVGSLQYASPEQFKAPDSVDGRADLYALGILLYELAAGWNPFLAESVYETLRKQLEFMPPPLRRANDRISAFLEAVVDRLLQKDPDDRVPSAADLRGLLEQGEDSSWWRESREAVTDEAWGGPPPRSRSTRLTALHGRDREIEALLAAWRRTGEEGGRLVLVEGPAGIGKSALVEEALDRIDEEAGRPSAVVGRALSRGRALWPFIEILERLFRVGELPSADRLGHLTRGLAETLPEMSGLAPALAAWILGTVAEGSPDLTRDALQSALAAIFRQLAQQAPLVLHLDDLQRADRETISFLPYLLRSVSRAPLLVVACRGDEIGAESEVGDLWAGTLRWLEGEDRFERLALPRLGDAAVEEILRERLQSERLVAELGALVRERSEGNPFRLFENLGHLERRGVLRQSERGWATVFSLPVLDLPDSVRELQRLRLGRLADDEREILDLAAVAGFRFDAGVLAEALEMKRIPLLTRLAKLERVHGLIRSEGAGFRFAEGSLHETVYAEIPPALRAAYHAALADVLLARAKGDEATGREAAFTLADHLLRGERGEEAAPFLPGALTHLGRTFRTVEGADLAERGLAALGSADPQSRRRRLDTILAARSFYNLLGRRDREDELLHEALGLARALEDAAAESRVQMFLSGLLQATGRHEEARQAGEESLRLAVVAGDASAEAHARMAIGVSLLRKGSLAEAESWFSRALEIRRGIGDRRGTGAALANLGVLHQRRGEIGDARRRYEEARTVFQEIGDRRSEALALNNLGTLAKDEGRTEEALVLFRESLRRKCEVGDRLGERVTLRNLATIHTLLDRLEDARRELEGALEIAREIGHPSGEAESLEGSATVLSLLGRHDEAVARGTEAAGLAARLGELRTQALALHSLGRVLLCAGVAKEARSRLGEALDLGIADPRLRLEILFDLAWADLEAGQLDDALARAGEHEKLANELGAAAAIPALQALLARILAARGEPQLALSLAGAILLGPAENVDRQAVAHAVLALHATGEKPPDTPALAEARAGVERVASGIADPEDRRRYLEAGWPARILVGKE